MLRGRDLVRKRWWLAGLARDRIHLTAAMVISTMAALATSGGWFSDPIDDPLITVNLAWIAFGGSYLLSTGLHHAFAYYNGGGMTLNDEPEPDLLDFAYIAFAIGTSFAIVEAAIPSRRLRRVVLGHSVLAFVFNTVLLGLMVTFLAG